MVGGILIGAQHPPRLTYHSIRVLPQSLATYWIGLTLVLLGLAFTVWARRHLASNWSSIVTLKQGHQLIRTGPYGWVRHPIYTGLLAAFLGSAIARGELRGFIGVPFVLAAFVRKLRIEERWMREKFTDAYERYCRDMPALMQGIFKKKAHHPF